MGILDKMGKAEMPGMFLLRDDCGLGIEFLGEKGPTVFRAFPSFSSSGVEMPGRLSKDDGRGGQMYADGDFSPWIYPEFGVKFAGASGRFTALTRTPGGADADVTPFKHFFRTLYRDIDNDVKNGTGRFPTAWYPWIHKGKGAVGTAQGALARPGWLGFMQGVCYENRGKVYTNRAGQAEPKAPCVIMLALTAVNAVEAALKAKINGIVTASRVEDFVIQDPVSCAAGRVMRFMLNPATGQQFANYSVNMEQSCPISADLARSMWKPWDQVLRFMTEEEQISTLCQHFDAAAIDYTFRTSPFYHLLPVEVKGAWDRNNGRVTVAPAPCGGGGSNSPMVVPQVNPAPAQPYVPSTAPVISFAPLPAATAVQSSSFQPLPAVTPAASSNVPLPPQVVGADSGAATVSDFRSRLQAAQQQMNK
jgi:hypothetical protein